MATEENPFMPAQLALAVVALPNTREMLPHRMVATEASFSHDCR